MTGRREGKRSGRDGSAGFRRRLSFESLEDRRLLATFTVTNLGDTPVNDFNQAPGTLRQAIFDANQTPDEEDTIQFAAGLSGTIGLATVADNVQGPSALLITSPITIQGNAAGIQISRAVNTPMRLFRVASNGDLTLRSLTLSGGFVEGAAGEIGFGGGIYVSADGHLQVFDSLLRNNEARSGATDFGGRGGGIYSDGGYVLIQNSTFSQNALTTSSGSRRGFGGGVYNFNGSMWIYNSTFAENTSSAGTGVYALADGAGKTAYIRMRNTIVQSPIEALDLIVTYDNGGTLDSGGEYNIIHDGFASSIGAVVIHEHLLGPLAVNDGPTRTHALLDTILENPAIDAGDPSFAANGPDGNPLTADGSAFDQRGAPHSRVVDGDGAAGARIDIGALEFAPPAQAPELLGDYNGDRSVNAADYSVWRNTLGTAVDRYSGADGDGNGRVEMQDYLIWKEHYGESLNQGTALPQLMSAPIMVTAALATVEVTSPTAATPLAATARQESAERAGVLPHSTRPAGRAQKPIAPASEIRFHAADRERWLLAAAAAALAPSGPAAKAHEGHVWEGEPETWQRNGDAAARASAFESFSALLRDLC